MNEKSRGVTASFILSAALLAPLSVILAAPSAARASTAEKPKVIRWIVAHDRGSSFFDQLLDTYAQKLEKKSGGALKVEFIASKAPDTQLDAAAYQQVLNGGADMSQLSAARAGVPIFDAPFVFRNYDHAEAVFNGPVGKKLLNGVSESSQGRLKGYAFTYSGGYRILVGSKPLNRLSDLKGLKVRRETASAAFLGELGAKRVDVGPEVRERPIAAVLSGALDLEETEVNRLALVQRDHPELVKGISYANLTRHRMYVTSILANEKFLAGLTAEQRRLLGEWVEELATDERKLSVDLEGRNLKALTASGLHLIELPKSERANFMDAAKAFIKKSPELEASVREIQAVPDTRLASQ